MQFTQNILSDGQLALYLKYIFLKICFKLEFLVPLKGAKFVEHEE